MDQHFTIKEPSHLTVTATLTQSTLIRSMDLYKDVLILIMLMSYICWDPTAIFTWTFKDDGRQRLPLGLDMKFPFFLSRNSEIPKITIKVSVNVSNLYFKNTGLWSLFAWRDYYNFTRLRTHTFARNWLLLMITRLLSASWVNTNVVWYEFNG